MLRSRSGFVELDAAAAGLQKYLRAISVGNS